VSSETFDTEVVIVNFDTGTYHSVQGTGVDVWRLIERGAAVDEIVSAVAARHAGDRDCVRATIETFIGQLVQLGLVVADAAASRTGAAVDDADTDGKRPFEPPVLNTFTDMQELLWLDPIHEVDEAGWPVAAHDETA
jgi:hypothetical protein